MFVIVVWTRSGESLFGSSELERFVTCLTYRERPPIFSKVGRNPNTFGATENPERWMSLMILRGRKEIFNNHHKKLEIREKEKGKLLAIFTVK